MCVCVCPVTPLRGLGEMKGQRGNEREGKAVRDTERDKRERDKRGETVRVGGGYGLSGS